LPSIKVMNANLRDSSASSIKLQQGLAPNHKS